MEGDKKTTHSGKVQV